MECIRDGHVVGFERITSPINNNPNQVTVRFSFCKHNTKEEVDAVVEKLKELV